MIGDHRHNGDAARHIDNGKARAVRDGDVDQALVSGRALLRGLSHDLQRGTSNPAHLASHGADLTEAKSAAPAKTKLTRRPAMQWAVGRATHGIAAIARGMGAERTGGLASAVARGLSRFVPENRLALANLAAAFPEKTEAERRKILAGSWDNLARTVAELPTILELVLKDPRNPTKGLTDRIEVVGADWILKLRDDGQTGIAFVSHLANWELLAPFIASFGTRLVTLYRAPRNPIVAADLARWRGDLIDLIESGPGAALKVANIMRTGRHFAMLMDQRLNGGPEVPFFGRPAPTNPIVARFARQFDCPVVGVHTTRLPGSRFRIEVTPPLDLPRDDEGKVDILAGTAAITAIIEGWVREHPEQWLWLHDRWGDRKKSRQTKG